MEEYVTCSSCNGQGYLPCNDCRCGHCEGTGKLKCSDCTDGYIPCEHCNSTGKIQKKLLFIPYSAECPECKGAKKLACPVCDGNGFIKCQECNGAGYNPSCPTCGGTRKIKCSNCDGQGKVESEGFKLRKQNKAELDKAKSLLSSVQVPTEDDITPVNGPSRYSFMLSELSEIHLQDWPPPQAQEMFGWKQAIAEMQRHWSILASKRIWSPYPIAAYCVGDASAPVPSSSLSSEEQAVLALLEDSEEKVRVRYFLFPLKTSKEQRQAVAQVIFETEMGAEVSNVKAWVDALREEELGPDTLRDISTAKGEKVKYKMEDLQLFATPKAEQMFEFPDLPQVEFEFPGIIRTMLFIHCGRVRASRRGGKDYYEVVGRLYESDNPQQTGENHVGKLYIHVYDYPHATRYKTSVERLEWHADGSFDIITSDGVNRGFTSIDLSI